VFCPKFQRTAHEDTFGNQPARQLIGSAKFLHEGGAYRQGNA